MDAFLDLLGSILRMSTPLLFASFGGLFSERSGVVNIALEGKMLVGAFFGAVVAYESGSPVLGLLAAALAGMVLASVYALFVIEFRADQIVAGTAINFFALGLTPFLSKLFYSSTGGTPNIELAARFGVGPILLAGVMVALVWAWFYLTPSGLWVRFAGEHPESLSTAGIRVRLTRWSAVLMAGVLAGIGGASLSLMLSSSFARNMTSGRGFMALAALILGKWKPIPTALACLLFGAADAMQIRLQGVQWSEDGGTIPIQVIQVLPYILTLLVLAGFVGQSRAPKALGRVFDEKR